MQTISLNVKGMTCGHCKQSVECALQNLEGITKAEVELTSGKAIVSYDEAKVSIEAIKQAIEEQGYDVVA